MFLDPSHGTFRIADDVKCISPCSPQSSASASSPKVIVGECKIDNRCDQSGISVLVTDSFDVQKLEESTPNSLYSDPHPSDRVDIPVTVMNPPVPAFSPAKEIDSLDTSPPPPTIVAENSPVVRKKLFVTPPTTPRLLKSPCSFSDSPLSMSPNDPSSQKKLLLGSPPPNPYCAFPSNLPKNDLHRRLVQSLKASSLTINPPDSADHS